MDGAEKNFSCVHCNSKNKKIESYITFLPAIRPVRHGVDLTIPEPLDDLNSIQTELFSDDVRS